MDDHAINEVTELIAPKLQHSAFERIKRWVTSRDTNGYPIPTWSYGPPGGGKTHLAQQLADDLKVSFIPQAFGPTTTDVRVIGFLNASLGTYVPGPAYEWMRSGGLWFMDELDNCEPSALVSINSLLANDRIRFPNGETVVKHKDCYALAGANTLGTGATAGFRRQSQDAAARSRWAKVKLEYDEKLERALSPVAEWVDYVIKVRAAVERLAKSNIWITPRDSIIGSAALKNGVPEIEVVDHLLAEFSNDAKTQIINECGIFFLNTNKPKPKPYVDIVQVNEGLESGSTTWNESISYHKVSKKIRQYE